MTKIREAFSFIAFVFLFLVMLDLVILFATVEQIASGVRTPHIAFWDSQVKAFVHIIK